MSIRKGTTILATAPVERAVDTVPTQNSGNLITSGGVYNCFPTTFTWINGTTAGPTGSLTGNSSFNAVNFGAIPAASASQSGIVTTDDQTFAGKKIFKTSIQIGNSVPNVATLYALNTSLRFGGNVTSFTPLQTGSVSLGASITGTLYTWKNLFLSGFLSKDNASYGLVLPSSSGWTVNKTIATTEDIPSTYLKSASASGNTLTLTKQDNTTVTFSPTTSIPVLDLRS